MSPFMSIALIAAVNAACILAMPAGQFSGLEDDAEFVPVRNTNVGEPGDYDSEGGFGVPIIIIRRTSAPRNPFRRIFDSIGGGGGGGLGGGIFDSIGGGGGGGGLGGGIFDSIGGGGGGGLGGGIFDSFGGGAGGLGGGFGFGNFDAHQFPSSFPSGFPFGSDFFPASDPAGADDRAEIIPVFDDEDEPAAASTPCGLICVLLTGLEDHIKVLDKEIKDLHDELHPTVTVTGNQDGEFDINNTTYTEEVLADGTVVRINRTVIADTNEHGHKFVFHSVVHNYGGDTNAQEEEEEIAAPVSDVSEDMDETAIPVAKDTAEDAEPAGAFDVGRFDFETPATAASVSPSVDPILALDEDPALNEVDDGDDDVGRAKIDDGLLEVVE